MSKTVQNEASEALWDAFDESCSTLFKMILLIFFGIYLAAEPAKAVKPARPAKSAKPAKPAEPAKPAKAS